MDPSVTPWLLEQGAWGFVVAILLGVIGLLWRGREKLLEKREDEVRALTEALNASTAALKRIGEAVESNTAATASLSHLAALRAAAFDEHSRRFEDFKARIDAALQQRAPR